MEIKKVTIQDGNYVCDIGVTVEEWKSILTDETLMFSTYKNALIKFYNEPEHKSTCKALGEKYNKNPQHFNRVITGFAKAVQKRLSRFEVIGTDNEPTYWIIPMTGKYLGKHFEWTLRPELVQAMEDLGMTEIENEYQQFKCLLAYFVVHLEYCVSKKEDTRGYQTYIAPIKDFKKSGQGYDGDKIQSQIQKWEKYQNGIVCINVNPTTFQGRGTYLNWKHTAINVNAIWEKNSVVKLKIVEDSYPLSNAKDVLENTLIELGIFDDNEPNDNLKAFFDKFNSLIIEWNKDKQNKEDMEQIKPYINLLKSNKNLILTGAPGTGKTYLTKQIAKQMIGVTTDEELEQSGQFAFVQFHPSYDHTDFVEGLRPTKPDENGNIGFELKDGIFKKFCNRALKNWIDSLKSIEELQKEQNIEDFVDEFLSDAIDNEIRFETTTHKIPYQIIEVNDDTVKIEHGNFNSRDYDPKNKYVIISKKDLIDILSISEKLKNKKNIRNVLSRNISSQNGNYLFSVYTEVHNRIDSSENQDSKEAKKNSITGFHFRY